MQFPVRGRPPPALGLLSVILSAIRSIGAELRFYYDNNVMRTRRSVPTTDLGVEIGQHVVIKVRTL